MATNTRGIKMTGLQKACSLTKKIENTGLHVQVDYNLKTHRIYAKELTSGTEFQYDDPDIIRVGNYMEYTTMQKIADHTFHAVKYRERLTEFYNKIERGL